MTNSSPGASAADTAADFESFFRREQPRLLAIAVAIVGDREVARELVQDSLLRAYRSWSNVGHLDSPGGWTRRVLINLSIDTHRRQGRERRALERTEVEVRLDTPELPTAALWGAVRELPRLQRAVVALHYVDDMPIADVAATLGVSAGSVKTSLSRARTALAPLFDAGANREVQP